MHTVPQRIQDYFVTILITTDVFNHTGKHSVGGHTSGSQCVTRIVVSLFFGLAFPDALTSVKSEHSEATH
jgi:hypothetical protein